MEVSEGKMTPLQKGNIKARYRMMYLRNLASIHKGVVLDNDNFTEWNLGFYTIHGDQGDINLGLHYLWKTEIYELANYLLDNIKKDWENRDLTDPKYIRLKNQYKALFESIMLTPTDGNGIDTGGDCGQFGLDNYEQVDDVLRTMYYSYYPNSLRALSKSDMNKEYIRLIDSYNEQGVNKVMTLHQNTEYKRKELPIKPTKEELGL